MILLSNKQNISMEEIENILIKNGINFKNTEKEELAYCDEITGLNMLNIEQKNINIVTSKIKMLALLAEEVGLIKEEIIGKYGKAESDDYESNYDISVDIDEDIIKVLEEKLENFDDVMQNLIYDKTYMLDCEILDMDESVEFITKMPLLTKMYKI
jgi:hypothetical protein